MKQKNKKISIMLTFAFLTFSFALSATQSAEARRKRRSSKRPTLCSKDIATSTMYFVPHIKDYCTSPTPCSKFKKEVLMQGSGTLSGNRLLTYQGKVENLGSCKTAFGASGACLTPFISVAADPRFYSMGDIIEMPSMKGKKITMPDGSVLTHPGYFIVQDTGGAIKGANRFDFFTGSFSLKSSLNSFGANGFHDPQMASKDQCSMKKQFDVVRRSTADYEQSLAIINAAIQDSGMKIQVAASDQQGGLK